MKISTCLRQNYKAYKLTGEPKKYINIIICFVEKSKVIIKIFVAILLVLSMRNYFNKSQKLYNTVL